VNAERRSHRGERGRRGPAVYRAGTDTHDESAVVLATHTGVSRAGSNPDRDAHAITMPASAVDAPLAAVMLPVVTLLSGTGLSGTGLRGTGLSGTG
jgi:hypothetical protein